MTDPPIDVPKLAAALGPHAAAVGAILEDWRAGDKVRRLWAGDASIWSGADEGRWLGWLRVVEEQVARVADLRQIAEDARQAGFQTVLLMGMGGSSLCPEVLRQTFGTVAGAPELLVLDSTVPAQVRSFAQRIDPSRTLAIVSSKSGGTTEPNVFKQFFFEQIGRAVGAEGAGSRFVAITDPGTKMHRIAEADHFRKIAPGDPSIGGRYSALSNFGMVPAAIMGLDVSGFLAGAAAMTRACGPDVPPERNPGVALGAILGALAQAGRDKITFVTSPAIGSLGAWIEQLIAESTGKQGKGLVPVDDEPIGPPEVYGSDRLFIYVRSEESPSAEQDAAVVAVEQAGHPVVRIALERAIDLGGEFFRWEIATAVAGSVLGINPFDQPDVEASKVATRKLSTAFEETGQLPDDRPLARDGTLTLFADPKNAQALGAAASDAGPAALVAAHLARIRPGDYFAINAYVAMDEANRRALQAIRLAVRDAKRVATTLGFGPRFLHSTGQLHKGGPNSGVFLQITSDDAEDLPIPGQKYTFGQLKQFQAQGDLEVLVERDRRVLRVHLGPDVPAGLAALAGAIRSGLN